MTEVERLADNGDIDYIVIESSGISEPIPVAQTFTYIDEELGIDLTQKCSLDTMVTVVDANRFWEDFSSGESLLDRKEGTDENDTREVIDLLIDQIEFANVILLNKVDLLTKDDADELQAVLHKLNSEATVIQTINSEVSLEAILHTDLFDFEKASQGAGWIKELNEEHHTPETEEFGISSFVYRRNRPLHPERFMKWLENWPVDIVRAKGFFWLASRNNMAGLLSQAGTSIMIQAAGEWIAAYAPEEREQTLKEEPELRAKWDEQFGDRINELVFIGIDMNKAEIIETLDRCLLTNEEMNQDWATLKDPLPKFTVSA
jgi:G3E family GTPase